MASCKVSESTNTADARGGNIHDLSNGVTRHGERESENEHVNQSDKRDGVCDGLVVWSDVEQGIRDTARNSSWSLSDRIDSRCIARILRQAAKLAL